MKIITYLIVFLASYSAGIFLWLFSKRWLNQPPTSTINPPTSKLLTALYDRLIVSDWKKYKCPACCLWKDTKSLFIILLSHYFYIHVAYILCITVSFSYFCVCCSGISALHHCFKVTEKGTFRSLSSTETPLSKVSAGAGKKAAAGLVAVRRPMDLSSFAPAVTLQSGFHNECSIEPLRRREHSDNDYHDCGNFHC